MKTDDFLNAFNRILAPLRDTVMLLTGKAVIKMVDDSQGIQSVQLSALAGETLDKVPRIQNFGFTSNPPVNSEAIIISLGGQRENVAVITADNREFRFKDLAPGESAFYTDDGTVIHLKKGGLVDVVAATKVLISVLDVEITGNLKVGGNTLIVGNTTVEGEGVFMKNVAVTQVVGAAGYTGPMGGAPAPMVTDVPIVSTAPITSSAVITGANVVGGGTDLATVKAQHNAHTHPETGTGGGTTGPTGATV